jgi:hypothetical protein
MRDGGERTARDLRFLRAGVESYDFILYGPAELRSGDQSPYIL